MIDPRSREWQKDNNGSPALIRNESANWEQRKVKHKVRDKEDNRLWFTINSPGVLSHLSHHHQYRFKKGSTFYLHMITANNLYHPAIKQFKVGRKGREKAIWPSCGYYCCLHHDVVADIIVEIVLGSKIMDDKSKMNVIWMNGKWLDEPIDAGDVKFTITDCGISHPLAPLGEVSK